MERFIGLIGIALIIGIAYLFSTNRKAINWRTVGDGLGLQVALAIFILKVPFGQSLFAWLGAAASRHRSGHHVWCHGRHQHGTR